MSTQVLSPFPLFTSLIGAPLNLGYVYIGEPNQDPQTSPKQAYWDAGLTTPATQPLRTNGGYIVNAGDAATVYVDGAFSIRVRSNNGGSPGTQVFYRANVPSADALSDLLAASSGSSLIGFLQSGTGAVSQTVQTELRRSVYPEQFGAVGDGATDDAAAFVAALAAHSEVRGTHGKTYLIGSMVTIGSGKTLIGNGATIKGSSGLESFKLTGDDNRVEGWDVDANGALYSFWDLGQRNAFVGNTFRGDVGHYIFCETASYPQVSGNRFDGEGISLITTSVVFEDTLAPAASNNTFTDVENWCVQVRGSSSRFRVTNNTCHATEYTDEITATAGQTVFNFTLSNPCHLAGIQVDDVPYDASLTFAPTIPAATPTTNFTVTFGVARSAGEVVKLIAHRAAENIQVNGTASDGTITGNVCAGGGDSGIVLAGTSRRIAVIGNVIKDFAYTGVSIEGGVIDCTVQGNVISGTSLVTTAITYSSGILIGGDNANVSGNIIANTRDSIKYGISLNVYSPETGSNSELTKIGPNTFFGTFTSPLIMPNMDASQRRKSVLLLDGVTTEYAERPDFDSAWTNKPADTNYWTYTLLGGTGAIRDTVVKDGGAASFKTVAAEYVDMTPTARDMFQNCIVTVSFWAKAQAAGEGYVTAYLPISGGLLSPPTVTIDDTTGRWYSMSFPVTDDIDASGFFIRIGGNAGAINVQQVSLSVTRL